MFSKDMTIAGFDPDLEHFSLWATLLAFAESL